MLLFKIPNLGLTKPILIEITGINIDIRTIYLSRDYKKDFKTHREKFLDEWEKKHKAFISDLSKRNELFEDVLSNVIDRLLVVKIEIRDFRASITDNVTTSNTKIITLKIDRIVSHGCASLWQEANKIEDSKLGMMNRIIKLTKFQVLILNDKKEYNLEESKLKRN